MSTAEVTLSGSFWEDSFGNMFTYNNLIVIIFLPIIIFVSNTLQLHKTVYVEQY